MQSATQGFMGIRRGWPALLFLWLAAPAVLAQSDELPSWADSPAKMQITAFVGRVADPASADFVPANERIAVFDNDGTLWSEKPLYFQAVWALERIQSMAAEHPEWRTTEPFKSAVAGDLPGLLANGEEAVLEVLIAAHAGMTAEEFGAAVADWLATAKHPQTGMLYKDMVYQPMLELLTYLRANDFKTYIVSGGGIDFLRVFAEDVYGVPPEHVIGSTLDASFEMRDGVPTIVKQGNLVLVDDKAGKPVGIYRHIGRRPLLAAGNSDGDMQMLQYTTVRRGPDDVRPALGILIHHTDAEREFAYDRESSIGRLDKALDAADSNDWLVVDMQHGWERVYPEAPPQPLGEM